MVCRINNEICFNSYEPEMFPGLIYRMLYPRTVLLIFVTGKVIIVGNWNIRFVLAFVFTFKLSDPF